MKQMTLATIEGFEVHGRATRKASFLARMEMLVPWTAFYALIELHYLKTGNGRPPVGLERMFLILGFSGHRCVSNANNDANQNMNRLRSFGVSL